MELRFFEDPHTGQPHIYNQGVVEDEVRQVLADPGDDRPSGDRSRTAMGRTSRGRFLRVIYVPDEIGNGVFVVTAFELRGKSLKSYRRRRRRKNK